MLPIAENDHSVPDAPPKKCCGACRHWDASHRANVAPMLLLGQCLVRPGEVVIYTASGRGCDVSARGALLFSPHPVRA